MTLRARDMMKPHGEVAFVVPWRPIPERLAQHDAVLTRLRAAAQDDHRVIESPGPDGPFSRAGAINDGIEDVADGTVVVMHDADCIVDLEALRVAIVLARTTALQVLPYTAYRPLTEAGSTAYLAGVPLAECEDGGTGCWSTGGVSAILARSMREVRGFDTRFRGWGFEDVAFRMAVDTLVGPTLRVTSTLAHLWHPSPVDSKSPEYQANHELALRYEAADGNIADMRALLDEPR